MSADRHWKKALIDFLKEQYRTIDNLKKDFKSNVDEWNELAQETSLTHLFGTDALETKREWAGKVTDTPYEEVIGVAKGF